MGGPIERRQLHGHIRARRRRGAPGDRSESSSPLPPALPIAGTSPRTGGGFSSSARSTAATTASTRSSPSPIRPTTRPVPASPSTRAASSLGDGAGLNPAMPVLKSLWDAGHLAIVRGVGYPKPSLSHFQAMSTWQSASTSGDVATGWLGRWLDKSGSDPLRVCSIGPTVLPAMSGARTQAAVVQDSTSGSAQLPDATPQMMAVYRELHGRRPGVGALFNAMAKSGRDMLTTSHRFVIRPRPTAAARLATGVNDGDIGTQLDVVSSLIRAELPTKAYVVTQNGYDTHSGELATQTQLLSQLDTAIGEFLVTVGAPRCRGHDLARLLRVLRRVDANGSDGSDHGTAYNVFVIGPSVVGGFYGEQPSLKSLDENGNLIFNVDFRSVYATVLEHVIGVDSRPFLGEALPAPRLHLMRATTHVIAAAAAWSCFACSARSGRRRA